MAGPQTGVPEPTPVAGDEASMAAANRAALSNSFQGLMASQAQSQNNYYGTQQDNAKLMEVGSHQDQARETAALEAELQQLLGEKGDFATTYRGDLISRERDYALAMRHQNNEDLALTGELQGDAAKARQAKRKENQDFKLEYGISRKNALDGISPAEAKKIRRYQRGIKPPGKETGPKYGNKVNSYGYSNRDWAAMTPAERRAIMKEQANFGDNPKDGKGDGKDKYGNTKTQRRSHNNAFEKALLAAEQYGAWDDTLLPYLTQEAGVDTDIAKAVDFMSQNKGYLSKPYRKRLRKLGVKFRDDFAGRYEERPSVRPQTGTPY